MGLHGMQGAVVSGSQQREVHHGAGGVDWHGGRPGEGQAEAVCGAGGEGRQVGEVLWRTQKVGVEGGKRW